MHNENQFFHVSRTGNIIYSEIAQSNNISIFNNEENKYYTPKEVAETIKRLFPNGLSRHGEHYLADKINYLTNNESGEGYMSYLPVIELVLELTRRAHFASLPSRLESFFAFESISDARDFKVKYSSGDCSIYIVEAQKYLKRDMNLLLMGTNAGAILTMAEKYWRGGQTSNPKWELLLSFPIKIISKVE